MPLGQLIVVLVGAVILVSAGLLLAGVMNLYLQSMLSGVPISLAKLVGWRLRRVDARTIVISSISAHKAGLSVPLDDLETHALAGGRVPNCVKALIAARRGGIAMSWQDVTDLDLSGTDPMDVVRDLLLANAA